MSQKQEGKLRKEIGVFGGVSLVAGMTIAIEPMVNMGTYEVKCLSDGWTVKTADGSLSAHYENTVLITKDEPIILTADKDGRHA